jgi:hypothetical protein
MLYFVFLSVVNIVKELIHIASPLPYFSMKPMFIMHVKYFFVMLAVPSDGG